MSSKRKIGQPEEQSGRDRKKQKVAAARTIAVQQPAATTSISVATSENLPSTIDVEKYAQARSFEINAMQDAMKAASASSTSRAWQQLPRHLRRRAASHDVRRVPLRLRDKARAEMSESVKKKGLGKAPPKRGKGKQVNRTESLLRRQRDKTWLETHIWHAKRMKMENMWGYRLAVEPTAKAFRPSHRASCHGSILHDASYHGLIELGGHEKTLVAILKRCCDPQSPTPTHCTTGSRACENHIYSPNSYPFGLIAPVNILWRATDLPPKQSVPSERTSRPKLKGRSTEDVLTTPDASSDDRSLWIRCHPAPFQQIFSALQKAASLVLDELAAKHPGEAIAEVEIADLRGQVNVFDIIGPKSNQVLRGALFPVRKDEEFVKFWSGLGDLLCSGQLPRGMVVGFTVQDPRLSFPPKNAKPSGNPPESTPFLSCSATLAKSDIWYESERTSLKTPKYQKKDLDERRQKNLIPGTRLQPLRKDDRIPILLIQRSITGSDKSSDLHGWTIIIPAGWSMAFFSSLTYGGTGTLVGGQHQCQSQAFEAGCPFFPRDYPFTDAYEVEAGERELVERNRWEKKPPAKRSNYELMGIKDPWKPDWYSVLGLEPPVTAVPGGDEAADLVPAQREDDTVMAIDTHTAQMECKPWLFRGERVNDIITMMNNAISPQAEFVSELNRYRARGDMQPLDISGDDLLKGSLVSIRLQMPSRGSPGDLSVIYTLEDREAKSWWESIGTQNPAIEPDEMSVEQTLSTASTPEDRIIGRVTAGNFSLARGQGFALGAIPLARFLELGAQCRRLWSKQGKVATSPLLVKVRDRDGLVCRLASLEHLT